MTDLPRPQNPLAAPSNAAWKPMAARALLCLVTSSAAWIASSHSSSLSTALYMVAFITGGWDLALQTWSDLQHIRFDTHFLMLLVVPSAIAVGAYGEGALLLFLFSTSAAMEAFATHRTHREIQSLLHRAPKSARLLVENSERTVPVDSLQPNDRIRIIAGEQIPVDASVTAGNSACDESTLSGESLPIEKSPGSALYSGTLNLWGALEARVLRPAADSALQRIIRLIESSQHLKAPTQRFTDRFGTRYTLLVLTLSTATFLHAWKILGMEPFFAENGRTSAFYRAIALLVVLSPCALVLSVPSAILSTIAAAARHGILFRGGSAVENLADVSAVALDKTGTLTRGELAVVEISPLQGSASQVLQLAASLASLSTHPVSRAITREAEQRKIPTLAIEHSENQPGKGIQGLCQGAPAALGNRSIIQSLSPSTLPPPAELPGQSISESWVLGPKILGRILLRDELRPQAPLLIQQLHRQGLHTVILTGDRSGAAAQIAQECGVQQVLAELLPEQKVQAILNLKHKGHRVAMIGDGVNDAPSLAAADVSVALGARGSDAAIEQAEVVLMHDRLENFILARQLSLLTRRVIRQNLAISLGTIATMAVVALSLPSLPLWIGVSAHEGSTVIVVFNSLRLLFPRFLKKNDPHAPSFTTLSSPATPPPLGPHSPIDTPQTNVKAASDTSADGPSTAL